MTPGADRPSFVRLVAFARPYLGVFVAAMLCATVYAGARNLRAWLIQPLLDDVLLAPSADAPASDKKDWIGRTLSSVLPGPSAAEPDPGSDAERERLAAGVRASLRNIVLVALVILLLIPPAHLGQVYLVEYGLGRVLVDIQQALCARLLALPLAFHHGMSRGERLSRTTNDASRAHRALDLLFGDVAQSILALVVGAVWLFTISWQLTLAMAAVAPLVAGAIGLFGARIRRSARRRQETQGDLTERLVEILSGIKIIKAFRAQPVEEESFRRQNLRFFRRSMRVVRSRALSRTVVETLTNAIALAVLVGGAWLVLRRQWGLTPGSLAAFAAVMATTYRPVRDLSRAWTQVMDALPSADRFFELLDAEDEPADPPDAVPLERVRQGIRFENVSFSYGREAVLRDVSLDVKAGEMVAIVGRTGAGKTTLADLLLRFYDPDQGRIEIDGVDLRRIARRSLLDRIAVVTQEPFLFAGTIRDNVRYGRPGASDAEVEAAARAAHVDEFAETLPDGFETEVGETGARLSGGQRQRVTIARALLRDPAILIFDEATSSLDARSERAVQDAVASLFRGRTSLVIAHRLSTIRDADRIVVLENGVVSAVGSHRELLSRGGLYQELVALQAVED